MSCNQDQSISMPLPTLMPPRNTGVNLLSVSNL
jgi:hypothetical protein